MPGGEIMKYTDTILKDIDWNSTFEMKHDGKNEITLRISFDEVLDGQAKKAFAEGVKEGMLFATKCMMVKVEVSKELLLNRFKVWGFEFKE
jgi:hypothetical protein